MPKYVVKKSIDAFVNYEREFEFSPEEVEDQLVGGETMDDPVAVGRAVVRLAEAMDHSDLDWGERDISEFDATGYVALDEDGNEIDETQSGKAFGC